MTHPKPTILVSTDAIEFTGDAERFKAETYDGLRAKARDLLALEARCDRLAAELASASKVRDSIRVTVTRVMQVHKLRTFRVDGTRVSLTPRGLHYTEE